MLPETYRLKPEAFAAMKKRTLATSALMVAILSLPFIIRFAATPNVQIDKEKLTIVIILLIIMLPVMVIRLLRRQRATIDGYTLVIDDHTITLNPSQTTEQVLSRIEITKIVKNSDGSFLIIGGQNNTVISVPAQVEDAGKLETRLAGFSPVLVNPPDSFIGKYFKIIFLATMGFLILFIYATDKLLVAVIGTILVATFTWAYIVFLNKNTDAHSARLRRIVLFVTLCIIAKMVYLLAIK